jgi:two-component system NarL family response regulator
MAIRVFLVDDHRMVREALCEVLRKEAGIEIVGEAGDASEALALAVGLRPDVIVLDIRLPDLNGIEVVSRLKDAGVNAKVIALSAFADRRFVAAMIQAGACAYVTKSAAGTELIRAISAVAANQGYFSPDIAGLLAQDMQSEGRLRPQEPLARREREVLRLIAEGHRSAMIAKQLHISAATVEVHRRNIMRKLGLHTVAELTKHAIREGIVFL